MPCDIVICSVLAGLIFVKVKYGEQRIWEKMKMMLLLLEWEWEGYIWIYTVTYVREEMCVLLIDDEYIQYTSYK